MRHTGLPGQKQYYVEPSTDSSSGSCYVYVEALGRTTNKTRWGLQVLQPKGAMQIPRPPPPTSTNAYAQTHRPGSRVFPLTNPDCGNFLGIHPLYDKTTSNQLDRWTAFPHMAFAEIDAGNLRFQQTLTKLELRTTFVGDQRS